MTQTFDLILERYNKYNKYSNEWLLKEIETKQFEYLYFYDLDPEGILAKGCFCQWYLSDFVIDGVTYSSAEKYMMAMKAKIFNDEEIFQQIMATDDQAKAKGLGRLVKNFDFTVWEKYRMSIIFNGNVAKFSQNEQLKHFLLSTGKKVIVESSFDDDIWGIGLSEEDAMKVTPTEWKGTNLLGYTLIAVRDYLMESEK